jgi:hypothetical protein
MFLLILSFTVFFYKIMIHLFTFNSSSFVEASVTTTTSTSSTYLCGKQKSFQLLQLALLWKATSAATICSTTAITRAVTSNSLPPQCSNYTLNTDGTRNAAYTTLGGVCDNTFGVTPMWVRFSGAPGTMLANCAVVYTNCDTNSAGWYSGVYTSTAGDTTNGTVCYAWLADPCLYSSSISVTNCNGYYVFALTNVPRCSLRYCTIWSY